MVVVERIASTSFYFPFTYKAFVDPQQLNATDLSLKFTDRFKSTSTWWNLNDILVFITWLIFGLVFIACLFTFVNRNLKPRPRGKLESGENSSQDAIPTTAETVDIMGQSRPTSRRLLSTDTTGTSGEFDIDDMKSEVSSLLGTEMGVGDRVEKGGRSSADTAISDNSLCQTLRDVLTHGIVLTQYKQNGVKQIKMFLVVNELRWRSAKIFSQKTTKADLKLILCVEWGKRTNNFHRSFASRAADDRCFSLITEETTYDFEAVSKVERDALAQGFTLLLEEMRFRGSSNSLP